MFVPFRHPSFGLSWYASWRSSWIGSARCPPHLSWDFVLGMESSRLDTEGLRGYPVCLGKSGLLGYKAGPSLGGNTEEISS